MKLIVGGESGWDWLERATYDGAIGIFYNDTWAGLLTYFIVGLILIFSVIGFITVMKKVFAGKKKKRKNQYTYFKN